MPLLQVRDFPEDIYEVFSEGINNDHSIYDKR
jgi:hypothetical protein